MSDICTKCNLYKTSHIDQGLYSLNCIPGEGVLAELS